MQNDPNKSPRALWIGLISSLWLIAALVGYYYTHKPFTVELAAGLLTALWRLLVVAGIISLAGGIGTWIIAKRANFNALTSIALQAALGAGILGAVVLLIGFILGVRPLYFAVLLIVGGVLARESILTWLRQFLQFKLFINKNGLMIAIALGSGLLLLWTLAFALAPPLQFDALTYHLALPHSYLLTGNMAYNSDNIFWGMPQQIEMLYTIAMSLAGTEAAVVLGWSLGVLTLLGLLGFVSEKFNLVSGWVAVACLLAGRSLVTSLSSGYTEWPVMLFGLGMLVGLVAWTNTSEIVNLILAAIFAGFALGSKYTAGLLILIGLAVITWDGIRRRNHRTFANLILFGGIAALVSLPWWVKNWLGTSNSFYPLLFPAGAMTQARLDYYTGTPWGTWLDMLILPWQATVWGVEGSQGFSWSIGPLLLGFGTLAWVGWQARASEQKRLISIAGITTLGGFIIMALASRWNGLLDQTRLYAAFFPAWAVLAAVGFDSLSNLHAAGVRFRRIAAAVIILVFSFNLIEVGREFVLRAPMAVLDGIMSPASYRTRNLGGYEGAMEAIGALPPGSRVLMLWETRSLSCVPICDPDEVIDRWYDAVHTYTSAEGTLFAWRAQGYTHLLLNVTGREFVEAGSSRISPAEWARLDDLLASLPSPEAVGDGYMLYQLTIQ